jgi:hypothetical protein
MQYGFCKRNENKIRILLIILFLFIVWIPKVHCQEWNTPPLSTYISPSTSVAFDEVGGRAVVSGRTLNYWLYFSTDIVGELPWNDLISYLMQCCEELGYTIDYDNLRKIEPNDSLARSVRNMMYLKKRAASATISRNGGSTSLIINFYSDFYDYYVTYIVPLLK